MPQHLTRRIRNILTELAAAQSAQNMELPGDRLHPLKGDQRVRSVYCFHVEIVTLTGYDKHSASGFQETSFGFHGFPERLGGPQATEPLSLPVLGELKIHTSGDTPCRYDTPQIFSFHKWINSLQ